MWRAAKAKKEGVFRAEAAYRKTFSAEEPCESAYLEIGTVSQCSAVFLNGRKVGESRIGFALRRYEVASFLKTGEIIFVFGGRVAWRQK